MGVQKNKNEKDFHINFFFVNEEYRSKKIGSKLLNKIEKEFNNYHSIDLLVNRKNSGALKFYKKNSFVTYDTENDDYKLHKVN